ncbi:ParA family protein, partial [Muribacter muris]
MRVQTFQKPFIVTVMSTKGGVTKSTNVANISAFCADHGLNVLMIDTDTQPTLSSYYHIKQQAPYGLYELVMRVNDHAKMRQADAVRSSKSDPLHLLI